jgi:hypothetical protein
MSMITVKEYHCDSWRPKSLATQLIILKSLSVQKCIPNKTSGSLHFYNILWLDVTLPHRRVPVVGLWYKVYVVDLKPAFCRFEKQMTVDTDKSNITNP